MIYDVHEDVPTQIMHKDYLPHPMSVVLSYLVGKIERFTSAHFVAVVCATDSTKERFLRFNENTITVRNYPKLAEFPTNPTRYNLRKDHGCYVGTISEVRYVKQMISAANAANVRLVLAGPFSPEELKEILEAYANKQEE